MGLVLNIFPLLRHPHQVLLETAYDAFCPSCSHAMLISPAQPFRQMFYQPRLAASRVPPASKLTGIQRSFL